MNWRSDDLDLDAGPGRSARDPVTLASRSVTFFRFDVEDERCTSLELVRDLIFVYRYYLAEAPQTAQNGG